MVKSLSRKTGNYLSTLGVLTSSFLSMNGWRAYLAVAMALSAGLLQPIPFAMLAQTAMAASRGNASVALPSGLELPLGQSFYAGIFVLLLTVVYSYFAARYAIYQNGIWQDRLFARFLEGSGRVAKPYYYSSATGLENAADYVRQISQTVMSAAIFGRMLVLGLRDGAAALVAFLMLGWLDAISLAVIIITILAFLPALAHQATSLARMRQENIRKARDVRRGAVSQIECHDETSKLGARPAGLYRPLYSITNRMLLGLSAINLLTGLALVAVLLSIFLWNGASVEALLKNKLSYFAILLIFLRSVQSLAGIAGRVSRNYNRLATLRSFLAPRVKDIQSGAGPATGQKFQVVVTGGQILTIAPGAPVYVLTPHILVVVQLVGLSNSLIPVTAVSEPGLVWISLFSRTLPSINTGPLAIAWEDWQQLAEAARVELTQQRCVFVVITPDVPRSALASSDMPAILYDGDEVLDLGQADQMYEKLAAVASAAKKRVRDSDPDEDDELM